MTNEPDLIDELSGLCSILPYYFDIWGRRHITSAETKKAILKAMGVPISPQAVAEKKSRPWNRFIEPVMVVPASSQPIVIPIHFPLGQGDEKHASVIWSLTDDKGDKEEMRIEGGYCLTGTNLIDGVRYVRLDLQLNSHKDIGYYDIAVKCHTPHNEFQGTMRLIITPDVCYSPHGRTWGITINLYSIYSKKSQGIGDLSDLKEFVEKSARLGAGFVGINPLHVIANKQPYGISPYSPISRLYKNFIYLDVSTGHNFKWDTVPYETVACIKEKALKDGFCIFYKEHYLKNTPSGMDLKTYIAKEGRALESFATFMAITSQYSMDRRQWPQGLTDHDGPEVEGFKKSHQREILFYQYVQWLMDCGLKEISDKARELGMSVGLYNDLAVGSIKDGSDVWSYPGLFAEGAGLGAPPDAFNLKGQAWGVLPFIPERLRESAYESFIEIIRKNLKHGGALRIDHALGLFRAFWVPDGMPPKDGAYVRYPSEDLLGIIALESVRQGAVIIAEDLGTITDDVREALKRFHMLSYRLFYFERNWPERSFLMPPAYPEMAIAGLTTHDLPTIYGYWLGRDIEVKRALNLYPDDASLQRDIEERNKDKGLILEALRAYSLSGAEAQPPCLSIYRFLSLTPSKLVAVSLDDILGVIDQQNMPGTIKEYPNWQRKMPLSIEEIFEDKRINAMGEIFRDRSR